MSKFENRVIVVTGAGSGIGRELSLNLAKRGAVLALADLNETGLEETRKMLGANARASCYTLNVADREAYQAFAKQVASDHGRVDGVINNAGIVRLHSLEQGTYKDFETSFDVNVWGVIYGCKEFLPFLKQSDQAWLCNISSGAGLIGIANYTSYNATKFAVRGFTEALRNELRDSHIAVSCVHPGGVATNIQRDGVYSDDAADSAQKLGRAVKSMSAADAADQILNGMEKRKKRILVGRDIKIIDILARLLPSAYDRLVAKYV